MLAKKKLEKSFTWKQKDEVGKLGHSLEDTRLSLVELFGKEQKAQDKIEELNTNLEIKVKNEIKKNEFKTRQLIHKSKLAQTGELLNMIAHQWRQPLNSISVISNNILFQMMLKKPTDKEKLKEDINSIVNHTQYLSSTITEFREFYKLDKEKEITTFENIIVTTLQIISPSLKGNCIKVVKNFNCFKDIKTLPSEIVQVLLNLLKNAEDILIENQVEHPIIVVNTYSKKDKAYLEIIDNAGGISKENIDVIFDPYFTTKESKEGTGLGLYMSKMIIEDHCNGSINVKNNETGAIFEISVDLIS
jgi:signal transduction histidine kinase